MGIFSYPKSLHRRRLSPGPFKAYRKYKTALREEFFGRCVYCRVPDYGLTKTYGVDNYRPVAEFPGLECDYSNLYYCCARCNTLKGPFWPTSDQLKLQRFIPAPCEHRMFDHLRYDGIAVLPHSATGVFAEDWLMLNEEERKQLRQMITDAAELTVAKLADARRALASFESLIESVTQAERVLMASDHQQLLDNVATLESRLQTMGAM